MRAVLGRTLAFTSLLLGVGLTAAAQAQGVQPMEAGLGGLFLAGFVLWVDAR